MNSGPEITVQVSSSQVPVKFRAEDSPTWGLILRQLELEHGPGVLKDGHGYNKIMNNISMEQTAPLGIYQYITQNIAGGVLTFKQRHLLQDPGINFVHAPDHVEKV